MTELKRKPCVECGGTDRAIEVGSKICVGCLSKHPTAGQNVIPLLPQQERQEANRG